MTPEQSKEYHRLCFYKDLFMVVGIGCLILIINAVYNARLDASVFIFLLIVHLCVKADIKNDQKLKIFRASSHDAPQ